MSATQEQIHDEIIRLLEQCTLQKQPFPAWRADWQATSGRLGLSLEAFAKHFAAGVVEMGITTDAAQHFLNFMMAAPAPNTPQDS